MTAHPSRPITGFAAAPGRDRPGLLPRDDDGGPDLHVLAARWSEKARRMRQAAAEARTHDDRISSAAHADEAEICAAQLRAMLLGVS